MGEKEVTAASCAALRRAAARGTDLDDLAETYDLDLAKIRHHLWGRCSHRVDEPTMPFE